ncbi:MAG: hypothetical protein H8E84_06655 [Flavobacteriales bacterium]|nr:hypothetical protein [Flavobacteriales bacterium]
MSNIRNILLISVLFLLFSCSESKLKYYEQNLETHKLLVDDINNYFESTNSSDLDISQYFTTGFTFYSFTAGSPKGVPATLKEYQNGILSQLKKKGFSIEIGHSIYLPGIDENTYEIDGSVRVYYKATIRGENTVELSAYRTVNFEDGKISGIWEWADYGGAINQVYK